MSDLSDVFPILRPGAADRRPEAQALLSSLRSALPQLDELLARVNDHWCYEDRIYRFYHQSFKVYELQSVTEEIVAALQAIMPGRPLNQWFRQIVSEGTGKEFESEHNGRWLEVTRPIVEAFLHARYFLEMGVRYGRELEQAPALMPSGWAAILYLHDMR